jgi:hypothetical protein
MRHTTDLMGNHVYAQRVLVKNGITHLSDQHATSIARWWAAAMMLAMASAGTTSVVTVTAVGTSL